MSAPDRYWFYERTVQAPQLSCALLRRIHGAGARFLAEDFCGSAAVARAFVETDPLASAIGCDLDPAVLQRAGAHPRLALQRVDLRHSSPAHAPADVLFVGNFSIGELKSRAELLAYLRRARARLARGGVCVLDTYGGPSAWRTGCMQRTHPLEDGRRIHYVWEQRRIDPANNHVENALSFRLEDQGVIQIELRDAFVYSWRLWSLAELDEALAEAGFGARELHSDLEGPPSPPSGETWIACISARRDP